MKTITPKENFKQARRKMALKKKSIKLDWDNLPDEINSLGPSLTCVPPDCKKNYKGFKDYEKEHLGILEDYYHKCKICEKHNKKLFCKTYYTVEDAIDTEDDRMIGVSPGKHTDWFCKLHIVGLLTRKKAIKKYLEYFPR